MRPRARRPGGGLPFFNWFLEKECKSSEREHALHVRMWDFSTELSIPACSTLRLRLRGAIGTRLALTAVLINMCCSVLRCAQRHVLQRAVLCSVLCCTECCAMLQQAFTVYVCIQCCCVFVAGDWGGVVAGNSPKVAHSTAQVKLTKWCLALSSARPVHAVSCQYAYRAILLLHMPHLCSATADILSQCEG